MSYARPTLTQLAFAAIAHQLDLQSPSSPEAAFLAEAGRQVSDQGLPAAVSEALRKAGREDEHLCSLASIGEFEPAEILLIALAAAVEQRTLAGRAVAFAQAPIGGSRPTLGLAAHVFSRLAGNCSNPAQMAAGRAVQSGVLTLLNEEAPLPERPVSVPAALCLALAGSEGVWPGGAIAAEHNDRLLLTESLRMTSRQQADALKGPEPPVLVLRSAHFEEARAVACEIARLLRLRSFFAESAPVGGLGAWLSLRALLPVFVTDPAPGEIKIVPAIPLHRGPVLVTAGVDGEIQAAGRETVNCMLPLPDAGERERLWSQILPQNGAALELAASHRQSAARIVQLGRLARHQARMENKTAADLEVVRRVSRSGNGSGLGSLAQPLRDEVNGEALVLPEQTRGELEALVARCRHRDSLIAGLGPSANARYTPGVRALFTGPSGTGKTLAACWLATRLGLPLFRVDLASVTSKYIGETEKNLARLLARAERTEAILLFDEADSLFGSRTDVRDANDRFANSQTNYLLQRIETFDGIALLTSNSRARLDTAFSRRLDMIIEFPLPGASERRKLWIAHLGQGHTLTVQELNLIAGQCDFAGGQIRNVVLRAAVEACESQSTKFSGGNGAPEPPMLEHKIGRPDFSKLLRALAAEYKKHGRSLPPALAAVRSDSKL